MAVGNTFNSRDFGACADGHTLDTRALQSAIDACYEAGGGVVQCDAGIYLTGSLELKSNVELHLSSGCKILGSSDIADYDDFISKGFKHENAGEGTVKYLIGAKQASNIAITGSGEVNVSGPKFFDHTALKPDGSFARKPAQRPRAIMMHQCVDVRIEDASFIDSPCWTFWIMLCERVHINRVKILGDPRLINNDGIDVDGCKDVTISDCIIRTDDDCIVIRAIQAVHEAPAICENVLVTNCVLESTCQCVRISCPSDHITRNCVFSNLTMKSSRNGINFDYPARYQKENSVVSADVSNILFSNITIQCKAHPIRIAIQDGVKLTRVSDIVFSNIKTESISPCIVQGNTHTLIENIRFSNVHIRNTGEEAFRCSNCRGVKMDNVEWSNL
jgi:polygalacturonase